jgi:membrane protease YdiL (CAAX protease family)
MLPAKEAFMTRETEPSPWPFFLLAYAFSWGFWVPSALAAQGVPLPQALGEFLRSPLNPAAFGPSLAAVVLTLWEGGWRGLGRWLKQGLIPRFGWSWLLVVLFLPIPIFAGATLLAALLGKAPLDLSVLANPVVALFAPLVILFTGGPLQEEFGWRGYALPRLQRRFNALASSVVLGGLWWLWHLPLVFIPGRFMTGSLPLFGLLLGEMVLTSVLFTWVYNNTKGSILAALLFHTSMNWAIWVLSPSMQASAATVGLTTLLLLVTVAAVVARFGAERLARATEA